MLHLFYHQEVGVKEAILKKPNEVFILEAALYCFFCCSFFCLVCNKIFKRNVRVQSKVVYAVKCSSEDVIVKALKHDHCKTLVLDLTCCCCCCLKEYFLNVDSHQVNQMKTEADSPNWYPLHTRKEAASVLGILCCCLTHFSENCVKMKPKYRLPTQRPD